MFGGVDTLELLRYFRFFYSFTLLLFKFSYIYLSKSFAKGLLLWCTLVITVLHV